MLATSLLCDWPCKPAESPEPTKLTTCFCTLSSKSSTWDLGATPQIWEQYSTHGRVVKIQDGFRNKETLGPIKGVHFPSSSLCNSLYIFASSPYIEQRSSQANEN